MKVHKQKMKKTLIWSFSRQTFREILLLILLFAFVHCSREKSDSALFFTASKEDEEIAEIAFQNMAESIKYERISWNINQVFNLEIYGCDPTKSFLENRFVLIIYFSDIHCETCFEESVANLRIMQREFYGALDFCFVANLNQERRMQWLNAMMKTSVISCPVFLDPTGSTSLPSDFCFYLVDIKDSAIVRRYYPQKGGPQTWFEFKEQVKTLIDQ